MSEIHVLRIRHANGMRMMRMVKCTTISDRISSIQARGRKDLSSEKREESSFYTAECLGRCDEMNGEH